MTMNRICFIVIFALIGCRTSQSLQLPSTTLQTGGPVELDVQSFAGDVTVIVDPRMTGVTVSVAQRDVGNQVPEVPNQITFSAVVEKGELGEILHVVATATDDPLATLRADITIKAQSILGVSIKTDHGNVSVLGAAGSLSIQTSEGDVRIVTPYAMTNPVTIENRRGDIVYRVQGDSSGLLDAIAMNGTASLDSRLGDAVILPGTTGDHLVASINEGVNPVIMRTVDGDVRVFIRTDPVRSEPWLNTNWISW